MKLIHTNFPTRLVEALTKAGLTHKRPILLTVKEEKTSCLFYAAQ